MPTLVYEIIDMLAALLRLLGVAALGVGIGYLAVDLLHKAQGWQMQAVGFLGLAGLVIAMVVFLAPGALGAFGIGLGVAIFMWGMPKKAERREGINLICPADLCRTNVQIITLLFRRRISAAACAGVGGSSGCFSRVGVRHGPGEF